MKTRQRLQGCVHFWGILNNENSISDLIKQYHLKYQCCWLLITHTKNGEYDLLFYTCLCLWRLCSTFFAKKKLWTLAWLYASIFDGVDGCHNCTSKISTGFFKFLAFFLDSCYCCLFDSIWSSLYRRG